MFLRNLEDITVYFKRTNLLRYLDEHNLSKKSLFYIKRMSRKVTDKKMLLSFKYWVLWRWVTKNFELTERFGAQLRRNIKKLKISTNAREEDFLLKFDELVFNSWRPLKQLPVKFDLEKKEAINLVQTNVNLHKLIMLEGELKPKMVGKFDLYYSNKKIYFTNENQDIVTTILYSDVVGVEQKRYGLIVQTKYENFLFRGRNQLLTYILMQRMIPELNLDVAKLDGLYQYFDYWNKILQKFN